MIRFFEKNLRKALAKVEKHGYKSVEQTLHFILDLHAPKKSKKRLANYRSYLIKTLHKAIMKSSELASKYHETKGAKNYGNPNKQRNFCSKLYKKEKRKFY